MTDGKRRSIVRRLFSGRFRPLLDITDKYRTPRIKMTRATKIALLALRLYLIFIIGILIYKFFTSV
ncbi:MAG TPA: hypothetical protein VEH08_04600 [Methanomassiliicoccales archaeon]|nr:hypothetical protein [Methanomassiliicoccales archaeon]